MKNNLLVACFFFVLPLIATPPLPEAMIRPLITDGSALAQILDSLIGKVSDDRFQTAFDSLSIKHIPMTQEVRDVCKNHSRSGAAVEVSIGLKDKTITYYLSTTGDPNALTMCLGSPWL